MHCANLEESTAEVAAANEGADTGGALVGSFCRLRKTRRASNEFDHAGFAVRAAAVAEGADVCVDCDCDPRTGNRREYCDIYRIQPSTTAHASGGEAGGVGSADLHGNLQ